VHGVTQFMDQRRLYSTTTARVKLVNSCSDPQRKPISGCSILDSTVLRFFGCLESCQGRLWSTSIAVRFDHPGAIHKVLLQRVVDVIEADCLFFCIFIKVSYGKYEAKHGPRQVLPPTNDIRIRSGTGHDDSTALEDLSIYTVVRFHMCKHNRHSACR